jgi:hypothetical protein
MAAPQYCYHCGGEIAEGEPHKVTPTEATPVDPRPL